jgi:hypothetical protein
MGDTADSYSSSVVSSVLVRLEQQGYLVLPATGALGPVDLVVLRDGERPLFVGVRSTTKPFEDLCRYERAELSTTARQAGGSAVLAPWAPGAELRLIGETGWPGPPSQRARGRKAR